VTAAALIAIVGAESCGKSTLARALTARLRADGLEAVCVDEYLREFCEQHGRTPRPDEQAAIAAEQGRRIEAARRSRLLPVDVVVADTTALMTAVYSEMIFGDRSLHEPALAAHRQADLTLLMATDLPWVADGLRDGPHARATADRLLRGLLLGAGLGFSVVAGQGQARLQAALSAWAAWQRGRGPKPTTRWTHACGRCGDPDCERHGLGRQPTGPVGMAASSG
jgi:nicotinamide riboside kinase